MDSYLLLGLAMALLSIWKTYSGPALAGFVGFSYPEMLLFNVLPALMAGCFGWFIGRYSFYLYARKNFHPHRPKLRRFVAAWKRYGNKTMATLAPVLVGIPLYTLVARRLRQDRVTTFILLSSSILCWSGLSYSLVNALDLSTHFNLQGLLTQIGL
ncbi:MULTISPECIES: hypothetical protein [Vibrio]|uniref:DedA family protein n=1 Tax=Vibrio qingdaonensis TaxID=2829491 RepID=A0A9X3HXP3_9VIBR|nr:hypothetical protein [Vibrio qingdaonensis]MCW8347017.1 hypothetical protein [Vibrio qingdaonensis]